MRLYEALENQFMITEAPLDVMTVSAIKAQTGTKEKIDRFLADFGLDEAPDIDELLLLLTVRDENVEFENGDPNNDMIYKVDTSEWELFFDDGDFDNTMLVASFNSQELGKLRDYYLEVLGDDSLDIEKKDTEFNFVLCSDVGELDEDEAEEMFLSFTSYIPEVSFQEQTIGTMTGDQFLYLANGMPIVNDKEIY